MKSCANRKGQKRNSTCQTIHVLPFECCTTYRHLQQSCTNPCSSECTGTFQMTSTWLSDLFFNSPGLWAWHNLLKWEKSYQENIIFSTWSEFICTRLQCLRGCFNLMFVCGFHYPQVHVRVLTNIFNRYYYWLSTVYY